MKFEDLHEDAKVCHLFKIKPSMALLLDNRLQPITAGGRGEVNGVLRRDEGEHVTTIYYEMDPDGSFVARNKFCPNSPNPGSRGWKA